MNCTDFRIKMTVPLICNFILLCGVFSGFIPSRSGFDYWCWFYDQNNWCQQRTCKGISLCCGTWHNFSYVYLGVTFSWFNYELAWYIYGIIYLLHISTLHVLWFGVIVADMGYSWPRAISLNNTELLSLSKCSYSSLRYLLWAKLWQPATVAARNWHVCQWTCPYLSCWLVMFWL